MAITISPVRIADVREVFGVSERALARTSEVIYEMPLTEETRNIHVAHRTKKMLEAEAAAANRGNPQEEPAEKAFSFKAVDTATGKIVGVARWTIYYQDEPVTKTIEEEAMSFLTPALPQVRTKAMYVFRMCLERIGRKSVALPPLKEGEDLNSVKMLSKRVYLDVLAVDPSHQGQGIGKALLQWGLDEADRLSLVTFLESTKEGRPLYEKFDFEPTISDTLDVTPFGLEGSLTHTVRLPLSSPYFLLITDKVIGHGQTTEGQKLRAFNFVLHRQKRNYIMEKWGLLQEMPIRSQHNLIIVPLKRQPSLFRAAHLLSSKSSFLLTDHNLLVA